MLILRIRSVFILNNSRVSSSKEDKEFFIKRGGNEPEISTRIDIRKMIQRTISRSVNLITLIGSGASLPAIPLMGNTFIKIRENLGDDELKNHLEHCVKSICSNHNQIYNDQEKFNDIEFLLSWLQHRIEGDAENANLDNRLFEKLKTTFIQSVKSSNKKDEDKVSNNYLKVVQGLGKSRQILARQQKNIFDIVNLFTTNYDLFHEKAIEESHYAYTDGFSNGIKNTFSVREFHRRPIDLEDRFKDKLQPVNPFFRLFKLHGSINWKKNGNNVIRSSEITDQNVLISPTSSKFALTQNEPYSDLFREFVNVMSTPNSIMFTSGFSFNDSHISNLIENSLDRPDFTLYAFVGDYTKEKNKNSTFYKMMKEISKSPNVVIIYPTDGSSYLPFDDFAYFMKPDTMNIEDENEKEKENE